MARPQNLSQQKFSDSLLKKMFAEIQLLRREVSLMFPQEDLTEYAHPERIKRSYERAIRKHTPRRT